VQKALNKYSTYLLCSLKLFVNEFNYLGILFNRTGNFSKAIKKQAEKATKAMFEVLKRGRTHNLSIECQLELLTCLIHEKSRFSSIKRLYKIV
jgi:hypothetical protein